jgi:hypothetical protein
MSEPDSHPAFAFDPAHPKTLAIYCSDGRFTRAVEELTRSQLDHERLDTLTMPGGPGCLSTTSSGFTEVDVVRKAALFLIAGHGIETVLLISHAGCGWYREKLGFHSPAVVERRQHEDLRNAARFLRERHPTLHVHLFHARPADGKVAFEPVAPA